MRSNPAIVMSASRKISMVLVVIGLQIVAVWIAGNINSLVNFSTENFSTNYFDRLAAIEQVSQTYQTPISIGSPSKTMGSGTR
jgi:hypothetical protein